MLTRVTLPPRITSYNVCYTKLLRKFPLSEPINDIDVLCQAYNGKIVNLGDDVVIAMVADEPKRVDNFLRAIRRFHPKEIVRGGTVALER